MDTVHIKTFEVEETKVSVEVPYKKQEVDSTVLKYYQSDKLSTVLQNETPAFIKSYGSGSLSTISLRGTGASHTQLFWNGVNITSPILGSNDFALVPVSTFDQVELHYGLSSLEDGSGGLGGSIQLNNNFSWKNKMNLMADLSAGSFGQYDGNVRADVGNQKFQIQTSVNYNQSKNDFKYTNISTQEELIEYQKNAELQQFGFFQNYGLKLKKNNIISLKYNYNYSDRNIPKIIKATQNKQSLTDDSFRSMLDWSRVGSRTHLVVRTAFVYERFTFTDAIADTSSNYYVSSIRNQLRYKLNLKGWLFQANWNGDLDVANSTNYGDEAIQVRNSIMASTKKGWNEKLFLHLLIREDLINDSWSPVQPSLGFSFGVLPILSWKANVARSYRFPSLNELYWDGGFTKGNPDLLPEEGWNVETGLQLQKQMKKGSVEAEVTSFYSKINNWILWAPDEENPSVWLVQNKQKVENKGVESVLKFNYNMNDIKFNYSIYYTYTSSVDVSNKTSDSYNKKLIYVPTHSVKWNGSIDYKNFELRYNYYFVDKRFITSSNNWYMPAYDLSSISLGKLLNLKKSTVLIRITVNNLFNKQYQAMAWRPMPGRNYMITVRYNFKK